MFWILRRTRLASASALFNSINNNVPGAVGAAPGGRLRKGYNKLCSDDAEGRRRAPQRPTAPTRASDSDSFADLSDDSDYDESCTCNVCDRAYASPSLLTQHQKKKRHFECSACGSLFPSLSAVQRHKEEIEHWSDVESLPDNSESEEDSSDDTVTSEELEQLL